LTVGVPGSAERWIAHVEVFESGRHRRVFVGGRRHRALPFAVLHVVVAGEEDRRAQAAQDGALRANGRTAGAES
jgi:hypothetical protein